MLQRTFAFYCRNVVALDVYTLQIQQALFRWPAIVLAQSAIVLIYSAIVLAQSAIVLAQSAILLAWPAAGHIEPAAKLGHLAGLSLLLEERLSAGLNLWDLF